MRDLMEVAGISKQAFQQMLIRRQLKEEEHQQLLPLITEIRKDHPRMSSRDMYLKICPSTMGRDQFERFCFKSGFRVNQLKNYRKTTNSLGVTRFPNLIKDKRVTDVNQVFVSDITYYEIGTRFYYLTFIMDLFNREIVGWSASNNLRTEETTLPALHQLIQQRGKSNLKGAIIHSDGGGQYYCKDFLDLTREVKILNSMTQEKVFENPHAERVNGIIKNNYLYPYGPHDFISLKKMLQKSVYMYNTGKPHSALKKLTPIEYLQKKDVDTENNSKKSYFPLPTSFHKHNLSNISKNKKVNVI